MDRIWQWAWDRYGARYSWAAYAVMNLVILPVYLFWSFLIVAVEGVRLYVEAAAVSVGAVPVLVYVVLLPGLGSGRLVDRWAAGQEADPATALDATYKWTRGAVLRGVTFNALWLGLLSVVVGAIAGATGSKLVQYGILGTAIGAAVQLTGLHSFGEAAARPARIAIAGRTAIGDALPRSRPTFAAWSSVAVLATIFVFAVDGAMLAAVFDWVRRNRCSSW